MTPKRNNSLMSVVAEFEATLREVFYDQPMAWVAQAREKMKDLPKTNFDLGCMFAERGMWRDAMFRFRIALYFDPAYPQARYNLGCCYYRLGQRAKAKEELKQVLREQPNHQDAIFMLSSVDPQALGPNQRPQSMPKELVTKFFTSIAVDYNQVEAENKYRGGVLVSEQLKPLLPADGLSVVDLGCGTGIAAIPFLPQARTMLGVDLTPAMTAQADAAVIQERKLYDRVLTADISALGDALPAASADLVLMVNVAQFVGALQGAMGEAARLLKPEGIFAVTVEPYKGETFGIVPDSGRFGHSPAYVKQVGQSLGLDCIKETKLQLYPAGDAMLLVFRKGTH